MDTATFDLVIRNAHIATATDIFDADIGIRDGRIEALAQRLPPGREEIDAAGRWVLPGGVDAHCHLAQPTDDGSVFADDFFTGTRSAACGGTTTVMPFALQKKGATLEESVANYHAVSDGEACIDYAFHLIVADPTPDVVERELPQLIERGYTSLKLYMTYDDLKLDDRQILDVLSIARREGGMTMIHAENTDCIAWLTERMLAKGLSAPKFHGLSRPVVVEREATHRAISLGEFLDTPVLIVHVSSEEATAQIRDAQSRGLSVYGETCPQYLFLTAADLDQPGHEGAKCICSPPPRDASSQQAIWDGLSNGTFQVFSSDHAPFRYNDPKGKQIGGSDGNFTHVPNGIPGIETRLPLLFSEGVMTGRIDINRFVSVTSTEPAKIYGLYPRKGTICIGADADLVIWNTDIDMTIRNDRLHHNVDYTPYEGRHLRAWPAITVCRGVTVYQDGEFTGSKGFGEYQRCDRPTPAKPKPQFGRPTPWLDVL
ncbi:dihydropyrimidinase [Allohahella marinimesophila]|uniref:Dihydropyrimidinase n=1 Tax=Allohahella marinimesophila TaxID=1054972 RepID=A0ABP7NS45_9GAMM